MSGGSGYNAVEQPPPFRLSSQDQPYLTPPEKPFDLWRVWGVGGKTNVWGRVSLRLSDLDFKGAERDGWEIPWPISYKDIAPYYDRVDQLIGVCGGDDDSGLFAGQSLSPASTTPTLRRSAVEESCAARGHPHRRGASRRFDPPPQRICAPATTVVPAAVVAIPPRSSIPPITSFR